MSSGRLGGSHGESYIVRCNTKSDSARHSQAHITAMFSASAIKQLPGNLVMDRIPCSNKNRLTTADRLEECNLQSLPRQLHSSFVVLNLIQTVIPVRRSKDRVRRLVAEGKRYSLRNKGVVGSKRMSETRNLLGTLGEVMNCSLKRRHFNAKRPLTHDT